MGLAAQNFYKVWSGNFWPDRQVLFCSLRSFMQEVAPNLLSHFDPPLIIQVEHPPKFILPPVLVPMGGGVADGDIAVGVLGGPVAYSQPKSCEVWHLDATLII